MARCSLLMVAEQACSACKIQCIQTRECSGGVVVGSTRRRQRRRKGLGGVVEASRDALA